MPSFSILLFQETEKVNLIFVNDVISIYSLQLLVILLIAGLQYLQQTQHEKFNL